MKKLGCIIILGVAICLNGCGKVTTEPLYIGENVDAVTITEVQVSGEEKLTTVSEPKEEDSVTVWTTYWDKDTVMNEVDVLKDKINTICYFAAYFDENNIPFIPEETLETQKIVNMKYKKYGWDTYLTFVNDKLLTGGGSSLKDTELLYKLLENKEKRQNHIDTILDMTLQNGFDGIEIDYEAIKDDMTLWNLFLTFVTELQNEAKLQNIKVRIVLEPSAPLDKISFPDGPEYVMMCYNLYGYGTEAGPKANKEFLLKMSKLVKKLPEPINMALSNGGFDFAADGAVSQLTEKECVELLNASGQDMRRDADSMDVVFTYTAEDGISHEVWYADNETLQYWMDTLSANGYHRYSIWRLGSNVTLQ